MARAEAVASAVVEIDRMLVETDAPYLSPEPLRKIKVCEPAFVVHTAAKVAEIKGVAVAELDRVTSATAAAFYRWPAD